ncbi:stabilin-2-like [Ylistrum balloti]|uniref:stabilin-2-like n=1 Tax=Ylistrum balloti TaxID=509963 RepID=UPI002905E4B7|nr:stabilin-2-like [Ylistrum balloti]
MYRVLSLVFTLQFYFQTTSGFLSILRFCNETSSFTFSTRCVSCSANAGVECPTETVKLTKHRGMSDCTYTINFAGIEFSSGGCRHVCQEMAQIPKCCEGYWGSNCDRCPGMHGRVCSGHGECNDTMIGTGTCQCHEGFTGYGCEKCTNETLYGPTCEEVCDCVNGVCDGGIHGTGACDCESGYEGPRCDQWIEKCSNLSCDENSRCARIHGYVMCSCNHGYEKRPPNNTCEEINGCLRSPLCHENAICTPAGPLQYNCTCIDGYRGDGYDCEPIDPCQVDDGGCVQNSSLCVYSGPGQRECQCSPGYEGYTDGVGCELIDVCAFTAGQCHEHSTCRTVGPDQFECRCKPGYGGDGFECYTNIVDRVKELNKEDPELTNTLSLAVQVLENVYSSELKNHGPFTLFIPNDAGFRTIQNFETFLNDTDLARQILRQHIVVGSLTLEDLQQSDVFYTLQGVPAQIMVRTKRLDIQYRYKLHGAAVRALLVKSDVKAANGIIHVTSKMLTNSPMVLGNSSSSILSLIKAEGRYNRLQMLIAAAGMESEFEARNITVVVCSNNAWDILPVGTLDYFMSDQGKDKLRVVLRDHIFEGVIEVADLINRRHIRSKANSFFPVQVTPAGAVMLAKNIRVVQADIPARNGLYHHLDQLPLPTDIYNYLPFECSENLTEEVIGPCDSCDNFNDSCPNTDQPARVQSCQFFDLVLLRNIDGCAKVCNRTTVKKQCCKGFHGDDCHPCPGGFFNPCNGNGKCTESGTCTCFSGFTGKACQQCEIEDKFGENCTQKCTCIRGRCDNGIKGTGQCKRGTCAPNVRGKNCDKTVKKCPRGLSKLCHVYAFCPAGTVVSQMRSSCTCMRGFEGDGHTTCNPIDPCKQPNRGDCDPQAICKYLMPGFSSCRCHEGWVGTGKYCYRGTACDTHRDCHENAVCRLKVPDMKTLCTCKLNFHGNGTHCIPNNMCRWNMGGCDPKADCTPLGPGTNNCTCWDGYRGDGYSCSPTILKFIEDTPELSKLAELLQDMPRDENILLSSTDQYTIFAPSNTAMAILLSRLPPHYLEDPDSLLSFLLSNMLAGLKNTQELLETVDGYDKFETLTDGFFLHIHNVNDSLFLSGKRTSKQWSRIVESHETANGYVHIIDRAIETPFYAEESPDVRTFFSQHPKYSRFGSLLESKSLYDELLEMNAYTLFVPNNDVISKYYNEKVVSQAFLSFYLLPNIRLTESFDDGEILDTMLGSTHPLSIHVRGDMVLVNGVLISEPDKLTMGGVIHGINGLLVPTLHRCDIVNTTTAYGECKICGSDDELPCPEEYKMKTTGRLIKACFYRNRFRMGCQRICEKIEYIRQCCSHYYGYDCLECPGGPDFPCNDNGVCDDGLDGNGTCQCYPGFSGNACQFCEVNNTVQSCGRSCAFNNGGCSQNAHCDESSGTTTCICKPGYIGDGSACDEPCVIKNGGCHHNATCQFLMTTGDMITGYVNCTCADGMEGDGRTCNYPTEAVAVISKSRTGMVVGVTVAVLAVLILIGVAIVIFLKIKRDSSGFLEVWSKVRRNSDSSCAQLHANSDDESNVAQPLSPTDVNFDNPLYNVSDNF